MKKYKYPPGIRKSAQALCDELKKYYPLVFTKKYDEMSNLYQDGSTFQQKMELVIFVELTKVGIRIDTKDIK